jgi:hypothetical protein
LGTRCAHGGRSLVHTEVAERSRLSGAQVSGA